MSLRMVSPCLIAILLCYAFNLPVAVATTYTICLNNCTGGYASLTAISDSVSLKAGDIIEYEAGTYFATQQRLKNKAGSADSPIIIRPKSGANVSE